MLCTTLGKRGGGQGHMGCGLTRVDLLHERMEVRSSLVADGKLVEEQIHQHRFA